MKTRLICINKQKKIHVRKSTLFFRDLDIKQNLAFHSLVTDIMKTCPRNRHPRATARLQNKKRQKKMC